MPSHQMPTPPPHERAAPVMGLVLAAGCSARMGRPKQLLPVAGRPLLQHVIDAARAAGSLAQVTVVLGHEADAIAAALDLSGGTVHVVVNPHHAEGASTSLRAGLRAAPADVGAVAVLLGDQPGIAPAVIDDVVAAFRAGRTPLARPTYDDGTPGHPVVIARRVWSAVEALDRDEGARALMTAHPEWLTTVPLAGPSPLDVDTPADYERVQPHAREE